MATTILMILLYSHSESWGELFFIGAITSLGFSALMWIINKVKEKKNIKVETKQVQQEIVEEADKVTLKIDYSFLCDELKEKCNPSNFMAPYEAKKVEISNSIYSQLTDEEIELSELIALRNRAIKELNISFSSQELYEKLSTIFNPKNFVNDNYDAVKLYVANKVYSQILESKNDIIELEKIATENNIKLLSHHNENCEDINVQGISEEDLSEDNGVLIFWWCAVIVLIVLIIIGNIGENAL
jgi:hypothetical protein